MLNRLCFLISSLVVYTSFGQAPTRGDFLFPIRPNQENYLSGTMGELRTTHFHAGIDIKTGGVTGSNVYAAADGYVQRIKVSSSGYGNVIYLAHPHNNTVTLYAHLEKFSPELEAYVRLHQYKEQSFQVNLFPAAGKFKVKQGDVIANSGNTGSSFGPHLHFEIRDKEHKVLNPLEFGFDEIKDNVPPTIAKIAFVTMTAESRINGMFGRFEFDIKYDSNGQVILAEPLDLFGNIGVEVYAFDRLNGAQNKNGVPKQVITLDNELVFEQNINSIVFDLQRNILVHTNYQRSVEGGKRFNKLYVDEGNELHDYYETNALDGVMQFYDFDMHHLDIRLEDSYGNVSQYNFTINDTKDKVSIRDFRKQQSRLKPDMYIMRDILEIKANLGGNAYCEADFYSNGSHQSVQMAYDVLNHGFYVYDLRMGLPDSVIICDNTTYFDLDEYILAGVKTTVFDEHIEIDIPPKALFDNFVLSYGYQVNGNQELFSIDNLLVPLRQSVTIKLNPTLSYDYNHAGVYTLGRRGNPNYAGGRWDDAKEQFVLKTKSLTSFVILEDSIPPKVTLISSKSNRLKYKIQDKYSGIGQIEARINGEWLLMHYDKKSKTIWTDENKVLKGSFVLEVSDNANNTTVEKYTLSGP